MDVRRVGKFAFDLSIVTAGVALLALAAGRLSEPIASVPQERTPIGRIAVARSPIAVAPARVAFVPAAPVAREHVLRPQAATRAIVSRAAFAAPVAVAKVRPRPRAKPALRAKAVRLAIVVRKPLKHVTKSRHRYGIAFVRFAPRVERTPEPPIGYEERLPLLRAPEPSSESDTSSP